MTYFQIRNDLLPAGISPSTIVVIPVIWSNRYLYGFVPLVAISAIAYVFVPLCIYFVYRMLHEMRNQLSERTLEMQRTLINTLVLQVTITSSKPSKHPLLDYIITDTVPLVGRCCHQNNHHLSVLYNLALFILGIDPSLCMLLMILINKAHRNELFYLLKSHIILFAP